MISPIQITYILALLEHKNFMQAAKACHVTQPTLSMQIKKAEETVGYPIIDRDKNPISLTPAGEKLLPLFSNILENYNEMEVQIQKLSGSYKAEVRVGIIPTVAHYIVPKIYKDWKGFFAEFDENFLRLEFKELTSEELLEAVRKKEIDCGIMAGPIDLLDFEQEVLFNEEILIFAPHFKKDSFTLEELSQEEPWLLHDGNCLKTQMINFCNIGKNRINRWNYQGGNLTVVKKMVEQEGGYTLMPKRYTEIYEINKNHLKTIEGYTPYRQILGFYLKRNSKKNEIKQLLRQIRLKNPRRKKKMPNPQFLPWK